jgi:hypothetical protein
MFVDPKMTQGLKLVYEWPNAHLARFSIWIEDLGIHTKNFGTLCHKRIIDAIKTKLSLFTDFFKLTQLWHRSYRSCQRSPTVHLNSTVNIEDAINYTIGTTSYFT